MEHGPEIKREAPMKACPLWEVCAFSHLRMNSLIESSRNHSKGFNQGAILRNDLHLKKTTHRDYTSQIFLDSSPHLQF